MSYSDAQDKLVDAFRELAVAYQNFEKEGGNVEFKIYRQELLLNIQDGASIGFVIPPEKK